MDYKKLGMKVLIASVEVIIAGVISVYGESPYYLAILPVLEGVRNYVKHRKDGRKKC